MKDRKFRTDVETAMLERLNRVRVSARDLLQASEDAERLKKKVKDPDPGMVGMFAIAQRHKRKPLKAQAVYFRLVALTRLLVREGAAGWTLPRSADGSIWADEAVFAAAAVHPLILRDNDFAFERESFLHRVLELSESKGTA